MDRISIAMAAIVIATWAGSAPADECDDTFASLYAKEIRRVQATPQAADDIALAEQILEGAPKAAEQPKLLMLMCRAVFSLAGAHVEGVPTAVNAMELLAEKTPAARRECLAKIVEARQNQYRGTRTAAAHSRAGDDLILACMTLAEAMAAEDDFASALPHLRQASSVARFLKSSAEGPVNEKLKQYGAMAAVVRDIREAEGKLAANPRDAAARDRLVFLHLVDRDDPNGASKLLGPECGEAARTYVPLAVRDPNSLEEGALMEMGNWYCALAEKASEAAKPAMRARAQAYYEAFLAKHPEGDAARVKATLALAKVSPPAKSAPRRPGGSAVAAVEKGCQVLFNGATLAGWETSAGHAGAWGVEDGCLTGNLAVKKGGIGAYIWAAGTYRDFVLDLEYKLSPNGDSGVFVRAGDADDPIRTGNEVQINELANEPPGSRDCGALMQIASPAKAAFKIGGKWNHLVITCSGSAVKVVLNDVEVVALSDAGKRLKAEGRLGLQCWPPTKVWFRNIRVKRLGK